MMNCRICNKYIGEGDQEYCAIHHPKAQPQPKTLPFADAPRITIRRYNFYQERLTVEHNGEWLHISDVLEVLEDINQGVGETAMMDKCDRYEEELK